jgi:hypothetical protein
VRFPYEYKVPPYEEFRTGLTFGAVRQMLWVHNDDPKTWRYKRRRTVLGFWHQLKQQLYAQLLDRIEAGEPPPVTRLSEGSEP